MTTKPNPFSAAMRTPATPAATPNPTPAELPTAAKVVSDAERKQFIADAGNRACLRPRPSFFDLATARRLEGSPVVRCTGKIRRGDVGKALYLQLPAATARRLEGNVLGPLAPSLIGLLEFALDELDRQSLTLAVANAGE